MDCKMETKTLTSGKIDVDLIRIIACRIVQVVIYICQQLLLAEARYMAASYRLPTPTCSQNIYKKTEVSLTKIRLSVFQKKKKKTYPLPLFVFTSMMAPAMHLLFTLPESLGQSALRKSVPAAPPTRK